jgi:putative oxidoreductase
LAHGVEGAARRIAQDVPLAVGQEGDVAGGKNQRSGARKLEARTAPRDDVQVGRAVGGKLEAPGRAEVHASIDQLALGLATPAAASAVFGVMLVAGVAVHLKQGFFLQTGGYEYTLVLGVAALGVAFTGSGRFSMDALLGLDLRGLTWGLLALAVGVVAGGIQIAARRRPAAAANKA